LGKWEFQDVAASWEIPGLAQVMKKLEIFPVWIRDDPVRAGCGRILHSCPIMGFKTCCAKPLRLCFL